MSKQHFIALADALRTTKPFVHPKNVVCAADEESGVFTTDALDAEDEDEEPLEPSEDDLTTSDHRRFYQYGKLAFELTEESDGMLTLRSAKTRSIDGIAFPSVEHAIRAYMDASQFWPNAWFISDHGNAHLMNLTEVK